MGSEGVRSERDSRIACVVGTASIGQRGFMRKISAGMYLVKKCDRTVKRKVSSAGQRYRKRWPETNVERNSERAYNVRMPPLKPLTKEEAIALARGPYATTVEIAVAASIAPFLWRELDEKSALKIRNGTVFFVSPDRPS